MVYQASDLLLHTPPDSYFTAFVFCATIRSYSFHWWLTPAMEPGSSRLRWLKENRGVHLALFFAGLTGSVIYGIFLPGHRLWLLLAAFVTLLYSAPKIPHPWFTMLRKIALGKTIFLAFVWMYVTTALPLQLSGQPWQKDFYLFAGSRFFLIYAICILFDYRDREYDRSIGIRSLITCLDEKAIRLLFFLSLLTFTGFTVGLLWYGYSFVVAGMLLVPGLMLAALYRTVTKKASDLVYYLLLDGLMAFSAMLTLLTGLIKL